MAAVTQLNFSEDAIDGNPLRGFFPFESDTQKFPHSLEYQNFSMHALMQGDHVTRCCSGCDFEPIDSFLNDLKSRNHQAVFRVVIDCPADPNFQPPIFLGCTMTKYRAYDMDGNHPDYSNPVLVAAMVKLIEELGKKYDGDQRIASIQVGLLGFWGEWHMDIDGINKFPSKDVQLKVLDAFDRSFKKTQICVSVDQCKQESGHDSANMRIGFHDDLVGMTTQDYSLPNLASVNASDKWKRVVIGGEMAPEKQAVYFGADATTVSMVKDVQDLHCSWLLNHYAYETGFALPADYQRALKVHRAMGYNFHIPKVELKGTSLAVSIQNMGNAPFYYDLFLAVAVDGQQPIVSSTNLGSLIHEAAPKVIEFNLPSAPSTPFDVVISLQSPMLYPTQTIKFANRNVQGPTGMTVTIGGPQKEAAPAQPIIVPVSAPAPAQPITTPTSAPAQPITTPVSAPTQTITTSAPALAETTPAPAPAQPITAPVSAPSPVQPIGSQAPAFQQQQPSAFQQQQATTNHQQAAGEPANQAEQKVAVNGNDAGHADPVGELFASAATASAGLLAQKMGNMFVSK